LDKHVEFNGSYKRAYYALIGPQKDVNLVHELMEKLKNPSGVYTLIMNCDNNEGTIEKEINLFKEIKRVDPDGDFTPLLLHHNRIYQGSPDDDALQKIRDNVIKYQNVKYAAMRIKNEADKQHMIDAGMSPPQYMSDNDEEQGDELLKQIDSNRNSLYFMYVTDVGISVYDYVKDENALKGAEDIIRATRKLAEDYDKLSENGIGHYDLHGGNIMCRKREGKLCLSIIDFGFGFCIEDNIPRNVLHFLFSSLNFDNPLETKQTIRHCDPVHYNMFIMCFGMLRRTLNRTPNPTAETVKNIIGSMYNYAFERTVPVATTPDIKNFRQIQNQIVESYRGFYKLDHLKGIWKRVCDKTYSVVCDFLRSDGAMEKLSARTRITGTQNLYVPDNRYIRATRNKTTFTILFDAFSMSFYDRHGQPCDETFLRKKSDEYSIANISSLIFRRGINAAKNIQDRILFQNECVNLQKMFSAPDFFLKNDQCVHTQKDLDKSVFSDNDISSTSDESDDSETPVYEAPRKRVFARTPGAPMGFQTLTPAAKRRVQPPTTLIYTPAGPVVNFPNVSRAQSPLLSRFPFSMSSPMQLSNGVNSERSPLAYQRGSGGRLGMEDIVPMETSNSIECELPGADTNFGAGIGFTDFTPGEVSRARALFSPYAPT